MTDLNVSTTMLADMGRSLGTLKDEFEHSSNIVDSFHGSIGSGELAHALGDFAGLDAEHGWANAVDAIKGFADPLRAVSSTTSPFYTWHWTPAAS